MRVASFSVLILLAANAASAQGTIAGCVRDKHRGGLPGVEVIALGQTSQTSVVTAGRLHAAAWRVPGKSPTTFVSFRRASSYR